MRTHTFVTTTILLASFAAAMPHASAYHDCIGGLEPCVEAWSSSSGDGECETEEAGTAGNVATIGARSLPVLGTADATVSTFCSRDGEYYQHSIVVRGSAGLVTFRVSWSDSHNAWATTCAARVVVSAAGTTDLPLCDVAGGPPSVPAILP